MWVPDTEVPANDFVVALFPLLGAGQREQVELTIVSLPETVPPNLSDSVKRNRNLLLSALGDSLVTEQAKLMLKQLEGGSAAAMLQVIGLDELAGESASRPPDVAPEARLQPSLDPDDT